MNLSQAFANFVAEETLSRIFDGEDSINLELISRDDVTASTKIGIVDRPTYDSALFDVASDGLYSKSHSVAVFDRDSATQIARSKAVLAGRLEKAREYDKSITFDDLSELDHAVSIADLTEILLPEFLVDFYYNNADGSANSKYEQRSADFRTMTYNTTLSGVNNYYFGHEQFVSSGSITSDYNPNSFLLGIDASIENSDLKVADGQVGAGITLAANLPGLQNTIQLQHHINSLVEFRLIFVRDGQLLVGPIRSGLFKIDGAVQVINRRENQNIIKLSLVKTWEGITQISGIRTSDSYLRSYMPDDGFFRNSANAEFSKTFKEDED